MTVSLLFLMGSWAPSRHGRFWGLHVWTSRGEKYLFVIFCFLRYKFKSLSILLHYQYPLLIDVRLISHSPYNTQNHLINYFDNHPYQCLMISIAVAQDLWIEFCPPTSSFFLWCRVMIHANNKSGGPHSLPPQNWNIAHLALVVYVCVRSSERSLGATTSRTCS